MKLVGVLILSLALCQAAEVKTSSKSAQKVEEDDRNTEKRALTDGNFGAKERRAPVLATATPTAGIEYADSKETNLDKSPAQKIYATPEPQVAKLSDVLSGQPVPISSTIARHLFSPVSVYQARLGSPTTYEVSAPVQSQLAYSEHKLYQADPQNSIRYFNIPQKLQAAPGNQAQFARLAVAYNQQPEQPIYFQSQQIQPVQQVQPQQLQPQQIQPQQSLYTQHQNQTPQPPQQILQYTMPQVQYISQQPQPQITYAQNQVQQPLAYPQGQVTFNQNQVQQPLVYQNPEQPQVIQLIQPYQGLPYARQQAPQSGVVYSTQPQPQGNVIYQQQEAQPVLFTRQQEPQPVTYNSQQDVQAAAFSKQQQQQQQQQEIQANAAFVRQQQQAINVQAQRQPAQRELKNIQSPAVQTKAQDKQNLVQQQNYNDKLQGQNGGAYSYASFSQGQPSPNYVQSQNYVQSSIQNTKNSKVEPQLANFLPKPPQQFVQQQQAAQQQAQQQSQQLQQQVIFIRPNHQAPAPQNYQQYQPQYHQVQQPVYPQGQEILIQNPGYSTPQLQPVAPTYAPVQYFGKFAQNIFGSYPQRK